MDIFTLLRDIILVTLLSWLGVDYHPDDHQTETEMEQPSAETLKEEAQTIPANYTGDDHLPARPIVYRS